MYICTQFQFSLYFLKIVLQILCLRTIIDPYSEAHSKRQLIIVGVDLFEG